MTASYFVYYRVANPDDPAARKIVEALLASVKESSGIAGRLLVRKEDPTTWMEIYEGVDTSTAFEAALERAVAACGFSGIVVANSGRHIERFKSF